MSLVDIRPSEIDAVAAVITAYHVWNQGERCMHGDTTTKCFTCQTMMQVDRAKALKAINAYIVARGAL